MTKWYDPGMRGLGFGRLLCYLFGCRYASEIGGGWCQRCSADHEIYEGPIWRRKS